MRVCSLFSGGGLGDYGLELAGMEVVFQCEIDSYCQQILKLRWPHVPKWKDIKTLEAKDIPPCDLIASGFLCTDISVAGKGEGIKGKQSGLWSEMFRIIRSVQPQYILVENVAALLGRGMDTVLGDLSSCGYDAEWDCIPAYSVGSPQQRDRIWIVAYSKHDIGKICIRKRISKKSKSQIRRSRSSLEIDSYGWPPKRYDYAGWNKIRKIYPKHMLPGMDDGATNRMDRLKLLGNGQVCQVVQWIGKRIMDFDKTKK